MARYLISSALFLLLTLLPFFASGVRDHLSAGPTANQCVYTVYVRTGTDKDASTDSTIGLELEDYLGNQLKIKDLKSWGGLMGILYNYYQKGNLDIFSGRGRCLEGPICRVRVSRSGGLFNPKWLCERVEVTMAAPNKGCVRSDIIVKKWLDNSLDFELNLCRKVHVENNSLAGGSQSIISVAS